MDIASRILPRARTGGGAPPPSIEGLLLAAGASKRMGGENKLLADINGKPMVSRVAEAMLESQLDRTTVVLGHEADAVAKALDGMDLTLAINPDHAQGQSASLRLGIDQLGGGVSAMMVVLGDMPFVDARVIDALIDHHLGTEAPDSAITLPTIDGQRGNPVVWGRSFFKALGGITGDTGGRALFETHAGAINPLVWEDGNLPLDADTPGAMAEIRRRMHPAGRGG